MNIIQSLLALLSHKDAVNVCNYQDNYYGDQILRQDKQQRYYLDLHPEFRIYFKKLDNKYRPGNVITQHSTSIIRQLALPFYDDQSTIVFIGYQVDKTWSNILGVYAVNILDKKMEWITDITNFGSNYEMSDINIIDPVIPPSDQLGGKLVSIKRDHKQPKNDMK